LIGNSIVPIGFAGQAEGWISPHQVINSVALLESQGNLGLRSGKGESAFVRDAAGGDFPLG